SNYIYALDVEKYLQGCDYIEQSEELMTASEGDAAVLKCKYNTEDQSPCLLWYKQQRNGFPKFVLMNLTFGQGHTELEIKARFSGNLDSKSSSVPLRIQKLHVIDSAVYYCALMSTLTTTHSPLIQKHETGITEHSWVSQCMNHKSLALSKEKTSFTSMSI
uniref:Ig-like domain-containing protein n=1 Tax=Electrophorus electricus TaxID=8005 RepID=A0AAY5E7Y5_ELEEL